MDGEEVQEMNPGKSMAPLEVHLTAVLLALENAGGLGLTGPELVPIGGWRFGASIHTLRKQGHNIESFCEAGRVWRYTLRG